MKIMVVMGTGFEDTEMVGTVDVLKRAKLVVDLVSFTGDLNLKSQSNLEIKADKLLAEIDTNDYDALVIPGGRAVYNVLDKCSELSDIIKVFVQKQKLVAAICAGPLQVGKLGLYKGHEFTCFPGAEEKITDGIYQPNSGVIRSKNFITAKSMAYTLEFGLEIVDYLLGSSDSEIVRKAIFGEK